jgi:hypothetical protein
VPATKHDVSRFLIASATTWTAWVFGVALRALLGEPPLRTRNVAIHMGKCALGDGDLAGRELDQLETRND